MLISKEVGTPPGDGQPQLKSWRSARGRRVVSAFFDGTYALSWCLQFFILAFVGCVLTVSLVLLLVERVLLFLLGLLFLLIPVVPHCGMYRVAVYSSTYPHRIIQQLVEIYAPGIKHRTDFAHRTINIWRTARWANLMIE